MADGLLSIQHRKEPQEPSEVKKKKKKSSYRYTLDSQKYLPRKVQTSTSTDTTGDISSFLTTWQLELAFLFTLLKICVLF